MQGHETESMENNSQKAKLIQYGLKGINSSVANAWFDPKGFERNPVFYERLGVRSFKRYIHTGDLMMRSPLHPFGGSGLIRDGSLLSLKRYETVTRFLEDLHLTAFSLFVATTAWHLYEDRIGQAMVTTGLNILINVYPVMLQRYNRSRLYRTIHRLDERS